MKPRILLLLLLALAACHRSDSKALPAIPDHDKLVVRDLQVKITSASAKQQQLTQKYAAVNAKLQAIQNEFQSTIEKAFADARVDRKQYEKDYKDANGDVTKLNQQLNDEVDKIFRQSGLDKAQYTIQSETLSFQKLPPKKP